MLDFLYEVMKIFRSIFTSQMLGYNYREIKNILICLLQLPLNYSHFTRGKDICFLICRIKDKRKSLYKVVILFYE